MLKTQQSVSLDIYPHFENRQNSLLLALISGFSSPNKAAAHDSSSMDSDHGSQWGLNRQIRIIWCVYSFILLLATVLPITVFPQNPQRKIMKWKKRTERGCGGRSDDDRRDEQSLQCVSVCFIQFFPDHMIRAALHIHFTLCTVTACKHQCLVVLLVSFLETAVFLTQQPLTELTSVVRSANESFFWVDSFCWFSGTPGLSVELWG